MARSSLHVWWLGRLADGALGRPVSQQLRWPSQVAHSGSAAYAEPQVIAEGLMQDSLLQARAKPCSAACRSPPAHQDHEQ